MPAPDTPLPAEMYRPQARLIEIDAIADGQIVEAPFFFGLRGAVFFVAADDDDVHAFTGEFLGLFVQVAQIHRTDRAMETPIEHHHGEVFRRLIRQVPGATANRGDL